MSDAPVVYVEDGIGVYRASAVGMCERALIAARMGMTAAAPPEWMLARFEEGRELEPEIMADVARHTGSEIVGQQKRVEVPVGEFAVIRGHIDGLTVMTHISRLVEAKAFGPSFMEKWNQGPESFFSHHPYYRDQLTVYMTALGLPALYAVRDKESGETHFAEIDQPPGDINEIIARVLKIELAGRSGKLPDECVAPSFPCPFFYLPGHGKEAKPVQVSEEQEFVVLAKECDEAREDKKRAEVRAKEANTHLMEYLKGQGVEVGGKVEVGGYVANRVASHTWKPDKKAMERDGVKEKYMARVDYEYATAKRKGGKE